MATRRNSTKAKPAKPPAKTKRAKAPKRADEAPARAPRAKTTPGRPGDLTPELARAICEDAGLGMPQVRIAEFASVDASTLSKWLDRGQREKSGIYRDLFVEFRRKQGERYREALKNIREAAFGDPQFEKWFLSRFDPAYWGRRDNVGANEVNERPEPGSIVAMLEQKLARLAQLGAVQLPDPAIAPAPEPPGPAAPEPAPEAEAVPAKDQGGSDAPGV